MFLCFNDVEPINFYEDKSNRWRNILTVSVLALGILSGFGIYYLPRSGQLSEVSAVFRTIENLPGHSVSENKTFASVKPATPKILLPKLVASSTPMSEITAVAAIAKDKSSGAVLFGKDEYEKRPIASVSKLMSALVLLEHKINWASTTPVVADENMDDNHMYAGEVYSLEDLWNAALIGSSNKAIMTMVDASGLSRPAFVDRMNEKARELGMGDTFFAEPTGLNESNVSTASDLSILLNEALSKEEIKETLLKKEFTLRPENKKERQFWNTNWLLLGWIPNKFKELKGGKTGYIVKSGYNFVMQVGDGAHDINVVVLGSKSHEDRFTDAKAIAEWAYKNYEWPSL